MQETIKKTPEKWDKFPDRKSLIDHIVKVENAHKKTIDRWCEFEEKLRRKAEQLLEVIFMTEELNSLIKEIPINHYANNQGEYIEIVDGIFCELRMIVTSNEFQKTYGKIPEKLIQDFMEVYPKSYNV